MGEDFYCACVARTEASGEQNHSRSGVLDWEGRRAQSFYCAISIEASNRCGPTIAQGVTGSLCPSCFAKLAKRFEVARPVFWKQPGRHVAMKRRKGPIAHAADKSMLHGIDVAIFDVTTIVLVIPDRVFPEATLPDSAFAALLTNSAQPLGPRYRFRERNLDQPPACREIGIAGGQSSNGVKVIGQYDECVYLKRMPLACAARRLAQRIDLGDQKPTATIEEVRREEPASARYERATIIWHTRTLTLGCTGRHRPSLSVHRPNCRLWFSARLFPAERRNKAIAPYDHPIAGP